MDTMTPQPQPALDHKQLKALAKASRPWYAKKRTWLLGFVGLVVLAGLSAGASGSGTKASNNGGVSTLSGNSQNPPQADVAITGCGSSGLLDYPQATLRITNHSTGRSDYMISVNFLDSSGTKIAEGAALSNNIDPGQSAIETAGGVSAKGAAAKCMVTSVNRFASH